MQPNAYLSSSAQMSVHGQLAYSSDSSYEQSPPTPGLQLPQQQQMGVVPDGRPNPIYFPVVPPPLFEEHGYGSLPYASDYYSPQHNAGPRIEERERQRILPQPQYPFSPEYFMDLPHYSPMNSFGVHNLPPTQNLHFDNQVQPQNFHNATAGPSHDPDRRVDPVSQQELSRRPTSVGLADNSSGYHSRVSLPAPNLKRKFLEAQTGSKEHRFRTTAKITSEGPAAQGVHSDDLSKPSILKMPWNPLKPGGGPNACDICRARKVKCRPDPSSSNVPRCM